MPEVQTEEEYQQALALRVHGLIDKSIERMEYMLKAGSPEVQAKAMTQLMPLMKEVLADKGESEVVTKMRAEFTDLLTEVRDALTPESMRPQPVEKPVTKPRARKAPAKKKAPAK